MSVEEEETWEEGVRSLAKSIGVDYDAVEAYSEAPILSVSKEDEPKSSEIIPSEIIPSDEPKIIPSDVSTSDVSPSDVSTSDTSDEDLLYIGNTPENKKALLADIFNIGSDDHVDDLYGVSIFSTAEELEKGECPPLPVMLERINRMRNGAESAEAADASVTESADAEAADAKSSDEESASDDEFLGDMSELFKKPEYNNALEYALRYARLGWLMQRAPLRSKHPIEKGWNKTATADPIVLRDYIFSPRIEDGKEVYEASNVYLVTGKVSGILLLDIDGEEGHKNLAKLIERYGPLPITPSAKGGSHYIFKVPDDAGQIRNITGIALSEGGEEGKSSIDIKYENSGCPVYPSLHPKGRHYIWDKGLSPPGIIDGEAGVEPAMVPQWLLFLAKKTKQSLIDGPMDASKFNPQGELKVAIEKKMLLDTEIYYLQHGAKEGERNDRLYRCLIGLRACGLSETAADDAVRDISLQSGLENEEIDNCIRSAYDPGREINGRLPLAEYKKEVKKYSSDKGFFRPQRNKTTIVKYIIDN